MPPLEIILKILAMKAMKILSIGVFNLILVQDPTLKIIVRLEKLRQNQILSSFSDLALSVSSTLTAAIPLMHLK